MLDAFAFILAQELLNLRFVIGGFINRDANLAAGAGHGLAEKFLR